MPDVEHISWFSRLGKSVGGVLVGLILFVVAFPLLWLNEGRAVHRARSLGEGAAACVSVDPAKVDDANDGKLVHVTGEATTDEILLDAQFAISVNALKLVRTVEIYHWVERSEKKRKKDVVGGGQTETTSYYHDKKWVRDPVDSSKFKPDDGALKGQVLQNRGTRPFRDEPQEAGAVRLGAFRLTKAQVGRLGAGEKLTVTSGMLDALPPDQKGRWKVSDGAFYLPFDPNGDPAAPQIGDIRITFTQVKPQTVSVLAKQLKGSFEPWHAPTGSGEVDELRAGSLSKEAMFQQAQDENTMITWLLRGGGFLLMFFGITLIFWPLVVFVEFLPLLGDLLGVGVFLCALLVALPLSLITIATAWLAYRPVLGGSLLGGALALLLLTMLIGGRRKAAKRRRAEAAAVAGARPSREASVRPAPQRPASPRAGEKSQPAKANAAGASLTCPHCGKALKLKTPLAPGSRIRCPGCQTIFPVPGRRSVQR